MKDTETYKLSRYVISTKLDENTSILFSTKSGESIAINSEQFGYMKTDITLINSYVRDLMFEKQMIVSEEINEVDELLKSFKVRADKNKESFSFTIQTSSNCQLGCDYCGQNHKKDIINYNLSDKIYNYIESITDEKELRNLSVTWYGGEPILGIKSIRSLGGKILKLSRDKNINYTSKIITNGLGLNLDVFKELVSLKIKSYQVTLDGDEEVHDNSRYTKSGKKTFSRITNNILDVLKSETFSKEECKMIIRCNVHENNFESITPLIEFFADKEVIDKISFSFSPVLDWGGNEANENIGISLEKFAALEIDWIIKIKKLKGKYDNYLPSNKNTACGMSSKSSKVIDPYGNLSYCWEIPLTPEFDYKDSPFLFGTIENEKPYTNKDIIGDWTKDIEDGNYGMECRECKFLPVCAGGCPIQWYKGQKPCPSFIHNIEDRLALQYFENKVDFTTI